ncbi:VanZ family protein [Akkermansiaceae bacterium]|nr:VanZ family protein [Akkermansiaceae bacterium]MDB4537650.1 VanZ family protein [Akkermansiaceae bacterium]
MNITPRGTRFWLSCLLGVLLLMMIFIMARDSKATWFFATVGKIPYFDKVGHFCIMGLISLCAVAGLAHRLPFPPLKAGLIVMGGVFVISTIDEISQAFIPSRTFSLLDLAASALGILCLGLIGNWISRRQN